jgi:bifunctional DNA-binding transcriptional regulator/antitoxin component of YhaV-PrlF toxin-antitoxin module
MARSGSTTVPKEIRDVLGAPNGARLAWQVMPDGSVRVSVKHAYPLARS